MADAAIEVKFGANLSELNAALAQAKINVEVFSSTMAASTRAPSESYAGLKTSLDTLNSSLAQNTAAAGANKTSWLAIAAGVLTGEAAYSALNKTLEVLKSQITETKDLYVASAGLIYGTISNIAKNFKEGLGDNTVPANVAAIAAALESGGRALRDGAQSAAAYGAQLLRLDPPLFSAAENAKSLGAAIKAATPSVAELSSSASLVSDKIAETAKAQEIIRAQLEKQVQFYTSLGLLGRVLFVSAYDQANKQIEVNNELQKTLEFLSKIKSRQDEAESLRKRTTDEKIDDAVRRQEDITANIIKQKEAYAALGPLARLVSDTALNEVNTQIDLNNQLQQRIDHLVEIKDREDEAAAKAQSAAADKVVSGLNLSINQADTLREQLQLLEKEKTLLDKMKGPLDDEQSQRAVHLVASIEVIKLKLLEASQAASGIAGTAPAQIAVINQKLQEIYDHKLKIMSLTGGVFSPEDIAVLNGLNAKMAELVATRQTLNDKLAGGTVAEKESLAFTLSKNAALERQLPALQQAADLIKNFEGFTEKAAFDVNHFRLGFGSDSKGGGAVGAVKEGDTTTREEAERDLARRIIAIQGQLQKELGASWVTLSESAKASLISVAYNYGQLPANIAAAVKAGDETGIASAISARSGDNSGVNARRRQSEASNITSGVSGALDPLAELEQKKNIANQELADAERNGTATISIRRKVADAEAAILTEKEARIRAAGQLEVANADGDKKQLLALAQAEFEKEAGLYGANSTQAIAAQAAVVRAKQALATEDQANAASAENAKYQTALKGANERITVIKEAAAQHRITYEQELSALTAVFAQQAGLEKAYYLALTRIYGENTANYRAAQQHLLQVDADINSKRLAAARAVSHEIESVNTRAIDQTASTFTTAITGMITGQTRFRDAARQIVTQMISTYLDLALKMVLNNSGAIGLMVAQTITGEAAKTAATTAGVAARSSAETAGSAAAGAGTIAAVLKSIFASGAETFAGIFGFLSPILGPAAAGPAAAGEATVLAVAGGLAQGAWSLPADMIVQAHRGEMVIPAGVTPWAQGVIAGAANTPGVNTVHVNHATNFTVTAMDSQSVRQFFTDHGRTIMRTINESVRTGSHVGLSKLGQGV